MSVKRDILVVGFPHCGTTILKSRLGDACGVVDIPQEFDIKSHSNIFFDRSKCVRYVVKTPFLPEELLDSSFCPDRCRKYSAFEIVFILRDPRYVFTSIKKRGLDPINTYLHTFDDFNRAAEVFLRLRAQPIRHIHTITYEELFDESEWHKLLHSLDLTINQAGSRRYSVGVGGALSQSEPPRFGKNHGIFREWQINQPFCNHNTDIDLTEDELSAIRASPTIAALWSM